MEQSVFEAKAVQRHLRKAPRKVRLVADSVRGKSVDLASIQLFFIIKEDISKQYLLTKESH